MFHNQMRPCELLHVNLRYKDDPFVDLKLRTVLNHEDLAALHLDPEGFGEFAESLTGRSNLGYHHLAISGDTWCLKGHNTPLNKPVIVSKPIDSDDDAETACLPGMEPPPRQHYEVTLTFSVSIRIIGEWKGYNGMHKSIGSVIDVEFEETDRVIDTIQAEVEAQNITQIVVFDASNQAIIENRMDQIVRFFDGFRNLGEQIKDAMQRWYDQQRAQSDTDGIVDAEYEVRATTVLDVPLNAITNEMLEVADLATLHRWYERLAGKKTEATSERLVRDMVRRRLEERQADTMFDEDDGADDSASSSAYIN